MLDLANVTYEVALCLTLVSQADDLATHMPRLGFSAGDLVKSAPERHYAVGEPADEVLHFRQLDSGDLLVLEFNGFQGTRREVLAALAGPEGSACSVFWNVNMRTEFCLYAEGDYVRLSGDDLHEPDFQEPQQLRIAAAEMRQARAREEYGSEPLLRAWLAQTAISLPSDLMLREVPVLVATDVLADGSQQERRVMSRDRAYATEDIRALAARALDQRADEQQQLAELWGGSLPAPGVLALDRSRAMELHLADRQLLDLVAALDDNALRALTAWVCRTASRRAGLEELAWVAPALSAVERGAPLPELFGNPSDAFGRLYSHWEAGAGPIRPTAAMMDGHGENTPLAPEAAALDALLSTDREGPLWSAIDALVGAGCSYVEPQVWYDEVRRYLTEPH